jgi:hypothetical protein
MQSAACPKRKRDGRDVEVIVCPSAFPDFTTVGGPTSRRRAGKMRNGDLTPRVDDDGGGGRDEDRRRRLRPSLDAQETIREVHKFGTTGFTGDRKRMHEDAMYAKLTGGRTAKRQKMPTKIIVGMRRKAMKREERRKVEERESGVVCHRSTTMMMSYARGGGTTTTTTNASASATTTNSTKKNRKKKRDKMTGDDDGGKVGPRGVFGSNRARNTGDRRRMSSRSFGPSPDVGFMLKGILKVKKPSSGGR